MLAAVLASALVRDRPLLRLPRAASVRCLCDGTDGGPSVSGMVYSAPDAEPTVRLFTKAGCTLCDVAKDVLANARAEHPHTLEAVDITDPEHGEWWEKYKYDIPVLHIDGAYWAKHRCALSPQVLARSAP